MLGLLKFIFFGFCIVSLLIGVITLLGAILPRLGIDLVQMYKWNKGYCVKCKNVSYEYGQYRDAYCPRCDYIIKTNSGDYIERKKKELERFQKCVKYDQEHGLTPMEERDGYYRQS